MVPSTESIKENHYAYLALLKIRKDRARQVHYDIRPAWYEMQGFEMLYLVTTWFATDSSGLQSYPSYITTTP